MTAPYEPAEGWQLVPKEPTKQQTEAASLADIHLNITPHGWALAYRAMLAAAPQPPKEHP